VRIPEGLEDEGVDDIEKRGEPGAGVTS